MPKIYLLGHTGSKNRGCEAIVRSTVKLIRELNQFTIILGSLDAVSDIDAGLDKICNIALYNEPKLLSLDYLIGGIERRVFHGYKYTEYSRQREIIKTIEKNDIVFIIGGDTYCYTEAPTSSFISNKYAHKRGAKTVLWACSLEEKLIDDRMREDLELYDYIVPREQLTTKTLVNLKLRHPQIITGSDPAFNLDIMEPILLKSIKKGSIGINLSPIVTRNNEIYQYIVQFVDKMLEVTNEDIVLVPHVYYDNKLDLEVLHRLLNGSKYKKRITLIDDCLSCEQIKYYISKCSTFIGCRTHSTIAAYSSGVPTLVLGYSIKSKGIAQDIFGTDSGYVMMYDSVDSCDALYEVFMRVYELRDTISKKLIYMMPEYKEKSRQAIAAILGDLSNANN